MIYLPSSPIILLIRHWSNFSFKESSSRWSSALTVSRPQHSFVYNCSLRSHLVASCVSSLPETKVQTGQMFFCKNLRGCKGNRLDQQMFGDNRNWNFSTTLSSSPGRKSFVAKIPKPPKGEACAHTAMEQGNSPAVQLYLHWLGCSILT